MSPDQERCLAIVYRLPKYQIKLLALLVEAPTADHDMVQKATGYKTPARISILKLRRNLLLTNVRIHSRFSLGWYLDDDTKERILEEIDVHMHFVTRSNPHEYDPTRDWKDQKAVFLELQSS